MKKQTKSEGHPYEVGKSYFIRTVTMAYTGKLEKVYEQELVLSSASWIADTGTRLSDFLKGNFNSSTEIEPFENIVIIPRGSIVDISIWGSQLPREQK